ncbi:MAG TPA: V-type ATPase subunit [Synergistaceae bacterium]|nr:V-type ATPase subunit [Synergistaceae bacterium]HPJ26053.1 V-type ATPase subunit [Synergistaceae bacterium]HPQ38195.1 V-type ATPase subunit [Synergistaceae bacterium]
MDSTLYGYANSRIKAMENAAVDSGVFQRVLETENLSGALKVLGETSYSSWIGDMEKESDFDKVIDRELQACYEALSAFVPDRRLITLFRLPYDFHNIKVVLKSMFLQKKGKPRRWDLLTSLGTVAGDDLITAIESEDYRMLPYDLGPTLSQCLSLWEQEENLLEIERLLDEHQFATMYKIAASTELAGVMEWCRNKIDAENIRNLLRLRRLNFDAGAAAPFLHKGGIVSVERLQGLLSEPPDSWERLLSYADVAKALREMEETSDLNAMLLSLETALDNYLFTLLARYAYDSFAPENILRFLWRKELEAKNLRIIFVSKSNGTPVGKTKGMLRHVA